MFLSYLVQGYNKFRFRKILEWVGVGGKVIVFIYLINIEYLFCIRIGFNKDFSIFGGKIISQGREYFKAQMLFEQQLGFGQGKVIYVREFRRGDLIEELVIKVLERLKIKNR